jgi:4-diphosphocytidyl-2-C-methyl-D-erythritol kinase
MPALMQEGRAKVNLTLRVVGRRVDGYHDLESVVAFADCADSLSLTPGAGLDLATTGPLAQACGDPEDNLVFKAAQLLRERVPELKLGDFSLDKVLPVAAGIGGGSADAAAALRLAAAAAGHDPAGHELGAIALELGADVPSQLAPERCLMTGIGEGVRPLGDSEPIGLLIVPSARSLSTPDVYAEFDRLGLGRDHDELDRLSGQVPGAASDGSLLGERLLHNDLEAPARSLCPPIGDALADVRAAGAVRAMVSGSGPTVFGLFPGPDGAAHARAAADALRARHPHAVAAAPVGRAFAAPVEV